MNQYHSTSVPTRITRHLATLAFLVIGILYLNNFHDVIYLSGFSLLYGIYLIKRLFDALGNRLPFKELILALTGIQLLISPFLEYHYFQNEIFGIMRVDELTYFRYVLPSTLALHLGINFFYPREVNERRLMEVLNIQSGKNSAIGWGLIIIGYCFYVLGMAIPIPGGLAFFVTILAFTRFIGFFYLWFAQNRNVRWGFIIVFIPFILTTVRSTIFIDLVIISVFLTSFYLMKYRVAQWKVVSLAILAFSGLIILQSVKYAYRDIVWSKDYSGRSEGLLLDMMIDQITNLGTLDLKEVGATMNIRLNQGWILTSILENMPNRAPFADGMYVKRELFGLLLPRFLYPNKPIVGDKEKFKTFVGWELGPGVSMNVGIMGDGYGNYGRSGGIAFCFAFGLILGYIFKLFYRLSIRIPTLPIWGILIFFYSMRAGNEFYIIANWIIKTGVVVWLYYLLVENKNRIELYLRRPLPKEASSLYSSAQP